MVPLNVGGTNNINNLILSRKNLQLIHDEKKFFQNKKSFHLSEYLAINFDSLDQKQKYKRIMKNRIERLRHQLDDLIDSNVRITQEQNIGINYCN